MQCYNAIIKLTAFHEEFVYSVQHIDCTLLYAHGLSYIGALLKHIQLTKLSYYIYEHIVTHPINRMRLNNYSRKTMNVDPCDIENVHALTDAQQPSGEIMAYVISFRCLTSCLDADGKNRTSRVCTKRKNRFQHDDAPVYSVSASSELFAC